jgi:hypothetical protein
MCHVETEDARASRHDKTETQRAACVQRLHELDKSVAELNAWRDIDAKAIDQSAMQLEVATSRALFLQRRLQRLSEDVGTAATNPDVRKQYGDLSVKGKATRRNLLNTALRDHSEELMRGYRCEEIAVNVASRLDGRCAVLVDQEDDGVETGEWNDDRARWEYHDDSVPVMRALRVRDDANISNSTSGRLAKASLGASAGKIKHAEKSFNERLTSAVDDGGYGLTIEESIPSSHADKSRATVQVSLLAYVTALFNASLVNMGPSQQPYQQDEKAPDDGIEFLDLLLQGDGRNMGKRCSNVQMSFAILNEGREVARSIKHHTLGIMDSQEDHSTLALNFKSLLAEVNDLEGKLFTDPITGVTYRIRMFLSGDWKFLRIVTGMAAPNQHHFCIWCKCTKDEIADLDMSWTIDRSEGERQAILGKQPLLVDPSPVEAIQLPPAGPLRWAFVKGVVDSCNLTHVLRTTAKDYRLGHAKDDKRTVSRHLVAMMQGWYEAAGRVEDDGISLQHADARIISFCTNLKTKQTEYKSGQQSAGSKAKGSNLGYVRTSLLPNIPFERILMDVLHCFLRVFDVLFNLAVEDACRIGTSSLALLETEVRDTCGITRFEFRYGDYEGDKDRLASDPDARPSRAVNFTDLDGNEKLRVMRKIDLTHVFDAREGLDVELRCQIWKQFATIYHHLSSWDSEIAPPEFKGLCDKFLETFLTTANIESGHSTDGLHCIQSADGNSLWIAGYQAQDVTPYIHCLTKHTHQMKAMYGGTIMQFACFALERTNGTQQASWHSGNNHGGGSKIVGDHRTRHHARSLMAYRQILLQHLRQTFNKSQTPAKYPCSNCPAEYETVGWCTRHWLFTHAPRDFDIGAYSTAAKRRTLLSRATICNIP